MEPNKSEMNFQNLFITFQQVAAGDPRIGPLHISLYAAILHYVNVDSVYSPFQIFRRHLKRLAKIGGSATYARCMQDLNEFGYVIYTPTKNPLTGSTISILPLKEAKF